MNIQRRLILFAVMLRRRFVQKVNKEEYLLYYECLKDVLDVLWKIDSDIWKKYEIGKSRNL